MSHELEPNSEAPKSPASHFRGPAILLEARGLNRRFLLRGSGAPFVEYQGDWPGFEAVLVNGEVVRRVANLRLLPSLVPCIEFSFRFGGRPLRGRVEVHSAGSAFSGSRILGLRLLIEDEEVYSEGTLQDQAALERARLPVPAQAPEPDVRELPIPVGTGEPEG